MHLLQPLFIVLLFIVVRSGDIAISSSQARDTIRTICYGLVAILALIALILAVL